MARQPQQQQDAGKAGQWAGSDPEFFRLTDFKGLNTKATRPAIDEQQCSWLENIHPVGPGNAQALWGPGLPIFNSAKFVVTLFFFNIAGAEYGAIFFTDGTASAVNLVSGAVTVISATPGTFYPGDLTLGTPSPPPACAQWGDKGILIVATAGVDNYWAFDGTLYAPGAASPAWLNGGTPTTMPTGIAGTAIETYQARAWVMHGDHFSTSAPGNGASFSSAVGGIAATPSSDSFLRWQFMQAKQNSSFLYLFADSSINVVSNVQTGGSPVLTTFNNQNVSANIGTPWRNSVQQYGDGLIFANTIGVWELRGGSAKKISDELDGIFANSLGYFIGPGALTSIRPSSAVMSINGVLLYMLLMPILDPFTFVQRNAIMMWDGKKWFVGSTEGLGIELTFIASQEFNSVLQAYGSDGTSIYPLFTTPVAGLNRIIQTKFWSGKSMELVKQIMRAYVLIHDDSNGSGAVLTGTVDTVLENQQNTTAITFSSSGAVEYSLNGQDKPPIGALVGMTLNSNSKAFRLISLALLYRDLTPLGG